MRFCYVDTSALLSVLFAEGEHSRVAELLQSFDALFSSPLLEAELRSALYREGIDDTLAQGTLGILRWVMIDRRISVEIGAVLHAGFVRGADLFHLATALFLADTSVADFSFCTLDDRQARVASQLGFPTPLQDM